MRTTSFATLCNGSRKVAASCIVFILRLVVYEVKVWLQSLSEIVFSGGEVWCRARGASGHFSGDVLRESSRLVAQESWETLGNPGKRLSREALMKAPIEQGLLWASPAATAPASAASSPRTSLAARRLS